MDHKTFTPAADVYSLGVIMTEISTGKQAFEGLEFIPETPDSYVKLAKRCIDPNPKNRPTAKSVNFQVGHWIEEILSSNEDNEIRRQFLENDNTSQIINTNKDSFVTSKPIDTIDILENEVSACTHMIKVFLLNIQ
ncbi:17890_t:CDS:2 [Cetraspora pellucida]|uniref:17890_t:CDS:1 n=1 Tax=Cetraspora pellucida TaxID=1433469 RepID=A0A9N9A8V6_9GLOM|nr:17890_t:CDS:2 [Cetraspora pellucida]